MGMELSFLRSTESTGKSINYQRGTMQDEMVDVKEQHSSKQGDDVAIIGMACLLPGVPNLTSYWHNILHKVDAITDPPPEAWDVDT